MKNRRIFVYAMTIVWIGGWIGGCAGEGGHAVDLSMDCMEGGTHRPVSPPLRPSLSQ